MAHTLTPLHHVHTYLPRIPCDYNVNTLLLCMLLRSTYSFYFIGYAYYLTRVLIGNLLLRGTFKLLDLRD